MSMNTNKDTDLALVKHIAGQTALQTLVRFTLAVIILLWTNNTLFPFITTWLEILTEDRKTTTTTSAR